MLDILKVLTRKQNIFLTCALILIFITVVGVTIAQKRSVETRLALVEQSVSRNDLEHDKDVEAWRSRLDAIETDTVDLKSTMAVIENRLSTLDTLIYLLWVMGGAILLQLMDTVMRRVQDYRNGKGV